MTSDTEEAVARVEAFVAIDFRHSLRTILSALSASQAEVERLTRERDEARSGIPLFGVATGDYAVAVRRGDLAEARATRAEGLLAEAEEWERRCANVEAVLSSLSKAAWRVVNARDAFRSPDRTNHPNLVLEEAEAWIVLREALDGKLPRAFLDKLKEQGEAKRPPCEDCGLDWCGATCGRWPEGSVDA